MRPGALIAAVTLAASPAAATEVERLVLAPEVRVPLSPPDHDRGRELSFVHGLGIPAARSELLARLGVWLPAAAAQRLPAVALAAQWLVRPWEGRLQPLLGVEFGGYGLLFEAAETVGVERVRSRTTWLWEVRALAGLGVQLWGPVGVRLLADLQWRQPIHVSVPLRLPTNGVGVALQLVVAPRLPFREELEALDGP